MAYEGEVTLRAGEVTLRKISSAGAHTNKPLTNLSVAYMQDPSRFIAGRIFPVVGVEKQSDIYYTFDRADWNRSEMKKRAPATESAGGNYEVGTGQYYAPVAAVHKDIDDQLRANADDQFNLDQEATNWVTGKGLLYREIEWARNFFTDTAWTTLKTGVNAAPTANQFLQWDDAAAEPGKDIKRYKQEMLAKTGFEPNTLVLGYKTYNDLTENDAIIDRIKYGQTPGSPAIVTKQALAALFDIERVEVLTAIQNTAAQGLAEANSMIGVTNGAALFYAAPSAGLQTASAGYTFAWTGYLGANAMGGRVSRFRMDLIRSDRIELELAFAHAKVADDLGIFLKDAVPAT